MLHSRYSFVFYVVAAQSRANINPSFPSSYLTNTAFALFCTQNYCLFVKAFSRNRFIAVYEGNVICLKFLQSKQSSSSKYSQSKFCWPITKA